MSLSSFGRHFSTRHLGHIVRGRTAKAKHQQNPSEAGKWNLRLLSVLPPPLSCWSSGVSCRQASIKAGSQWSEDYFSARYQRDGWNLSTLFSFKHGTVVHRWESSHLFDLPYTANMVHGKATARRWDLSSLFSFWLWRQAKEDRKASPTLTTGEQ